MQQVLWRIPVGTEGIPIYGFGMMLFLAFLICTWLAGRHALREGIAKETVQDLAIWIFVGGLLGARITYLLNENPRPGLWEFLKKLPMIWEGGIVLYGSVIGGVTSYFVAYYLIYRQRGLQTRRFLDAIAPSVALGLALGRLGCFLNGCCYGQVACAECGVMAAHFPLSAPCREVLVDAGYQTVAGFTLASPAAAGGEGVRVGAVDPASAAYAAGLRAGAVIVGVNGQPVQSRLELDRLLGTLTNWPRGRSSLELEYQPGPNEPTETITIAPRTLGLYPTQVYETISMLLLMLVLLAYYPLRHNPGQICAVLMVGYGIHRYLNEILRDDPRPVGLESYGSVFLVVAGVLLWVWLWRKAAEPAAIPLGGTSEGRVPAKEVGSGPGASQAQSQPSR